MHPPRSNPGHTIFPTNSNQLAVRLISKFIRVKLANAHKLIQRVMH